MRFQTCIYIFSLVKGALKFNEKDVQQTIVVTNAFSSKPRFKSRFSRVVLV
jgi:hypothetical protein